MNLKAQTISLLIASVLASSMPSQVASAGSDSARSHHRGSTLPAPTLPAPTVPDQPRFPGFPGAPVPGNPKLPPLPNLPPPGKHNPAGGPEVPFPLSITLPFPWGNIEGMWKVVADDVEIFFSFSVQTDLDGHQFLRVLQIDSKTHEILATGVGIGVETDKLVRAAMTSKVQANYMLFIGSYKNTSQYVVGGEAPKSVTVLTVRPFTDLMGAKDLQAIVTKVSNEPFAEAPCASTAN